MSNTESGGYQPENEKANEERNERLRMAINDLLTQGDDPQIRNAMYSLFKAGEIELLNEVFRLGLQYAIKYIDKGQKLATDDPTQRLWALENGIGHRSTHMAAAFLSYLPHDPEEESYDPDLEKYGRLLTKLAAANYQAQGQYVQAIDYYKKLGLYELAAKLEIEFAQATSTGGRLDERSTVQKDRDIQQLDEALQEWYDAVPNCPPATVEGVVSKIEAALSKIS